MTEFLRAPSALPEVGIRLGVRPCVRLRQPSLCVLASVANRRLGRSIGRSGDSPRLCGCNASDGGEEDQKAAQKADRNPGNWRMRLASHNFTFSAFAWSVLQVTNELYPSFRQISADSLRTAQFDAFLLWRQCATTIGIALRTATSRRTSRWSRRFNLLSPRQAEITEMIRMRYHLVPRRPRGCYFEV